jgi:hypothetical protein
MDEINPESPRTDVTPAAYIAADDYVAADDYPAPVASAPAKRGAGAADREHGA